MEMKQLVESIVREVVQNVGAGLQTRKPKILYIFADSVSHQAYTDHYIQLHNAGIVHDLMFLDGETAAWLGKHRIESGGPGKVIAVDEFAPAPIEVPLDYCGIIIPEIDLDTMSRVSLGLKGTVLSEVILAALMLEKLVLIGEDTSGLTRADRVTLKLLAMPKPFANLFSYYKKELTMYGAQFGQRSKLAELAIRSCKKEETIPAANHHAGAPNNTIYYTGGLLSAEAVTQFSKQGIEKLSLSADTILSPLAIDMLRENRISIQYAEGKEE
jgi:hypothetical protein